MSIARWQPHLPLQPDAQLGRERKVEPAAVPNDGRVAEDGAQSTLRQQDGITCARRAEAQGDTGGGCRERRQCTLESSPRQTVGRDEDVQALSESGAIGECGKDVEHKRR